jgi:hypothetical protein
MEKSMEILNSLDLMSFRTPEGEFGFSAEKFFEGTNISNTKTAMLQVAQRRGVEVNKEDSLNNIVSGLVNGVLKKSNNYDQEDLKQSNFDLLEDVAGDIKQKYSSLQNQKEVKGKHSQALQESRADRDNISRAFG